MPGFDLLVKTRFCVGGTRTKAFFFSTFLGIYTIVCSWGKFMTSKFWLVGSLELSSTPANLGRNFRCSGFMHFSNEKAVVLAVVLLLVPGAVPVSNSNIIRSKRERAMLDKDGNCCTSSCGVGSTCS